MSVNPPDSTAALVQRMVAPFPGTDIRWRNGSYNPEDGTVTMLPYVTARAIQVRLDETFTPFCWKPSFTEVIASSRLTAVRCSLELFHNGQWIAKEDAAHVDHSKSKVELAVKGAYSDALKRAAVQWGIGRYLHELAPLVPAVPCEEVTRGRDLVVYVPLVVPELPPDYVPAAEREEQVKRWAAFLARVDELKLSLAEAARQRQNQREYEAGHISDYAQARVHDIVTGARETHLPRTDAFSVREPLIPANHRPQVAPGEEPASVTALLGDEARARATGHRLPVTNTAETALSVQADSAQASPQDDVQKSLDPSQATGERSASAPSQEWSPAEDKAAEQVVSQEPAASDQTDKQGNRKPRTSRSQDPAHAEQDARIAAAARRAAEEAVAQAASAGMATASSDAQPAQPPTQEQSTAAQVQPGARTEKAPDTQPIATTLSAKSGTLQPLESWTLGAHEDKAYFDDFVNKIVKGTVTTLMLSSYVQAPRTKKALSEATREFLAEHIRSR